jgi:hypothetical protein
LSRYDGRWVQIESPPYLILLVPHLDRWATVTDRSTATPGDSLIAWRTLLVLVTSVHVTHGNGSASRYWSSLHETAIHL